MVFISTLLIICAFLYNFPLECKAGFTMSAKSLKSYREKYSPTLSLRTGLLSYERNEGVRNIPLYLLFTILDEIEEAVV